MNKRKSPIPYSDEELAWIEANRTLIKGELFQAFQERFNRPDVSADNLMSLKKRKGWKTGRTGHFSADRPGMGRNTKPNKTSFKKGSIPANIKPLYSERITKNWYIEIKVPEPNPYTGSPTRYRLKHQWIWEQAGREIPKGHILQFKDGNTQNCTLENLEVIPRAQAIRRNKNQVSSQPPELKDTVRAISDLQYLAHKRTKEIENKT